MRSSCYRGQTLVGAGATTAAMALLNGAFQAAGNVPDLETCTFLSGDLVALMALYPALAACISFRLLRSRAATDERSTRAQLRAGMRAGLWGSAAYFAGGVALALASPHAHTLPPSLGPLLALYIALTGIGGRMGAAWAAQAGRAEAPTEVG